MQKRNNTVQYDLKFLEKAFAYLKNYEILGIDFNEMYHFSSKEKQALLKLQELYSKIKLVKDYQTVSLDCFQATEALAKANSFLLHVFPKKKEEILELDNFITFDDISIYEAGLIYKINHSDISFDKILIPNDGSNYSSSIIVHEKMHAITFQNIDPTCLFRNGLELLPIFLQRMMLYYSNDNFAEILDRVIRINDTRQAFYYLDFRKYLNSNPSKSPLDEYICNYCNISSCDYLIGEFYSSLLMKYYLLDKDKMIKKLNQVLEQKLSIPEFLNSYHINLLNPDLIPIVKEETNKCKRISIIP